MTEERYKSLVKVKEPNECWPWRGHLDSGGYGQLRWNGANRSAQAVAFEIDRLVDVPKVNGRRLSVCHYCDNRSCCNPSHLFLGSQSMNMLDAVKKGRVHGRNGEPQLKDKGWHGQWSEEARNIGVSRQRIHQLRTGYSSPSHKSRKRS